jgi:TusA-related sulfurtransferase
MTTTLDITKDRCPMTFVKVKLGLSKLNTGDILDVTLDGLEPLANIPKAAREQGHNVLSVRNEGGHYRVVIEKT